MRIRQSGQSISGSGLQPTRIALSSIGNLMQQILDIKLRLRQNILRKAAKEIILWRAKANKPKISALIPGFTMCLALMPGHRIFNSVNTVPVAGAKHVPPTARFRKLSIDGILGYGKRVLDHTFDIAKGAMVQFSTMAPWKRWPQQVWIIIQAQRLRKGLIFICNSNSYLWRNKYNSLAWEKRHYRFGKRLKMVRQCKTLHLRYAFVCLDWDKKAWRHCSGRHAAWFY